MRATEPGAPASRVPLEALADAFRRRFGRAPEAAARAPGRVNLIGEHTDYNDGLVLPCAIDRDTMVLAAVRDDGRVRAASRELDAAGEFAAAAPVRRGDWLDHVQGVCFALRERGLSVPGADLWIASDVPLESGLSSSAALGVGVATVLDALLGLRLPARERARVAHRGESAFVGVGCGIMDPFASALGARDHALRIDCRSREVTPVPLPGDRVCLLVVDSGVRRALARGGYADRRRECEAAFAAARAAGIAPAGATALRDLSPDDLPALERALDPLLFRRTRHVVTENARVDAFLRALARGDLAAAGERLREGQRSLRDDFEVSTPELDLLCALADAQPGVYGARLTGAGLGGATLHLVSRDAVSTAAEAVARGFERRFGRSPARLAVRPAAGAERLLP